MKLHEIFKSAEKPVKANDHRVEIETNADEAPAKILALLKEHCKDALVYIKEPIWRGAKRATGYGYIVHGEAEGTTGRQSANTSNYYTMLLDKFLPPEFPRRGKSIICANNMNKSYAQEMGILYAVFPFDGVKIGVTQKFDLWDTDGFKIGNSPDWNELPEWNGEFRRNGLSPDSWEQFKAGIEEKMHTNQEIKSWMENKDGSFLDVEETFKKAYSAHNLGMQVATTRNFYDITGSRECWISGKCIMVRDAVYQEIRKLLEE